MNTPKTKLSGTQLLADFQSAFISLSTIAAAQYQAQASEETIAQELASATGGGYLNPGALNPAAQESLSHASLNAHVMKVQAQQMRQLGEEQINSLQIELAALYGSRKITVSALPGSDRTPFDAVWFDNYDGFRSNEYKTHSLSGRITEINLRKNYIALKPKMVARLFNQQLTSYIVYVINPDTMEPAVSISI